jgi:hypothetical protein
MTNLVGKYFVEGKGEGRSLWRPSRSDVAIGKVMEQVEPGLYLITYHPNDPNPPLRLKTMLAMTEDDYCFFATLEAARAELRHGNRRSKSIF